MKKRMLDKTTTKGAHHTILIGLRVNEELRDRLDEWRRMQKDLPSRTEAIRRLVDLALYESERIKQR